MAQDDGGLGARDQRAQFLEQPVEGHLSSRPRPLSEASRPLVTIAQISKPKRTADDVAVVNGASAEQARGHGQLAHQLTESVSVAARHSELDAALGVRRVVLAIFQGPEDRAARQAAPRLQNLHAADASVRRRT